MQNAVNGQERSVWCQKNANLKEIKIKNSYFMLLVLQSGKLEFYWKESLMTAKGPCCVCFDARENPVLAKEEEAEYFVVCFAPEFLNENMTLEWVYDCSYEDAAQVHDLCLLSPFLEKRLKGPLEGRSIHAIWGICENLSGEMEKVKDIYWYYRCRSYFIELLIELERMVNITEKIGPDEAGIRYVTDKKIQEAIRFIRTHYKEKLK